MRIVLQRVARASVTVDGSILGRIDRGYLLLVAAGTQDRDDEIDKLASKVFHLRVFNDEAGKMNRSISEVGGSFLVVSQFTLYGDVRKGRRPSWLGAAAPEVAQQRVEAFAQALERLGGRVERGRFQAHMEVELLNDGPVTLILDGSEL
jgi:D-tyrosyl-tRNA(Tyr) deacylase